MMFSLILLFAPLCLDLSRYTGTFNLVELQAGPTASSFPYVRELIKTPNNLYCVTDYDPVNKFVRARVCNRVDNNTFCTVPTKEGELLLPPPLSSSYWSQ